MGSSGRLPICRPSCNSLPRGGAAGHKAEFPHEADIPQYALLSNFSNFIMNPYVSNPDDIPATDRYADVPFYGRYFPRPDDFRADLQHVNSQSADSLQYWSSVLDLCNESVRIYPADEGGRDVFALGSIIVKSSHLHTYAEIDYSFADANEVQAIGIAKCALRDVAVPDIYFAGKVHTFLCGLLCPRH